MASALLRNRLRRQIRAKVWPLLEEAGFVEFGPFHAHRLHDDALQIVEFATFAPEWGEPRWLGGEAYANGATFALHVGTYYRAVDRLPWARRIERPRACECHRRACLAHESMDSACDGRTFWPGPKGERLEEIVAEAARVLQKRGLGLLDDHRDLDAWLQNPKPEPETVGLTAEEAAEMLRRCREGRDAPKTGALDSLHRHLHLSDEHDDPCADVLPALLVGKGRLEDALKCVDESKRERLLKLAA